MLKKNTFLKHLMLKNLGLTDLTARHIASVLVDNHSLKSLNISMNKISSVEAAKIFKAQEKNDTWELITLHHFI